MNIIRIAAALACALTSALASAADYPAPKEDQWIARDFRFHTGEVMPELRLHYRTVGNPSGDPVLILHGTGGSGASMLTPAFAGELLGSGQPLDASKYFIILPDAIGTGKSSKPSDGLRASFPKYNYDDMVDAQYRLVKEHLGVRRVRLVLGNSMSGNYTQQPRSLRFASVFYGIATSGGNQALQKVAPTREKADQLLNQRLSAPFRGDANDLLYQWASSGDYNAAGGLERIQAALLAINSADDERNPPELGLLDREITRVKNGRVLLIPGSDETAGHGTTARARFWKQELGELLQSSPAIQSEGGSLGGQTKR